MSLGAVVGGKKPSAASLPAKGLVHSLPLHRQYLNQPRLLSLIQHSLVQLG